ncbi:phytoene/squalene synthase family protein [Rhodobacter calidifons]|uniref:Squalene/phytoene synthase family protein n=1 Tax=Rhodobacter calidifons TaxID=2715277 RepID=A0ABX0GB59_9RHOB|nr:squalene/phytoene synthase family protein [Rhodobacter calidifons]NHB78366.1 squalene/phytoene synthase family protein [Rhodobacter calidifons]
MTPEAMLSHHARSFAPAARLLSRKDHAQVARLYALCRTVDDLADTIGGPEVHARLSAMAADLRAGRGSDPLAAEALVLFAGRPAGLAAYVRLVETVAEDTGATCIPNDAALESYCTGVAGTVGVMVCALFDVAPRWHARAADLGKAMQLTNICRDVFDDAAAGRRYLPYTLCPHTPGDIAAETPEARNNVRIAVAELLTRADVLYAVGRTGLPALPLRLRLAVSAATAMYAGIGSELRARACDPAQGRVYVPTRRKLLLVSQGLLTDLLPRFGTDSGQSHAPS